MSTPHPLTFKLRDLGWRLPGFCQEASAFSLFLISVYMCMCILTERGMCQLPAVCGGQRTPRVLLHCIWDRVFAMSTRLAGPQAPRYSPVCRDSPVSTFHLGIGLLRLHMCYHIWLYMTSGDTGSGFQLLHKLFTHWLSSHPPSAFLEHLQTLYKTPSKHLALQVLESAIFLHY